MNSWEFNQVTANRERFIKAQQEYNEAREPNRVHLDL